MSKYKVGYFVKTVLKDSAEDANATSDDILKGKSAYGKDGVKYDGNIKTYEYETEVNTTSVKELLDATKNASFLFSGYKGESVDHLIKYDDTENVVDITGMFLNCENMINPPKLNTSKVQIADNTFANCKSMEDFSSGETVSTFSLRRTAPQNNFKFDCSNMTSVNSFFANNSNLKNIYIENMPKVKSIENTFQNLPVVESIYLGNCKNVGSTRYVIEPGEDDHVNGVGLNLLVKNCPNLKDLTITNIDKVTTLGNFIPDKNNSLETITLDGLPNLETANIALIYAKQLKNISLLNCPQIENCMNMASFFGNTAPLLEEVVITNKPNSNISIVDFYENTNIFYPRPIHFEEHTVIYCVKTMKYYVVRLVDGVLKWQIADVSKLTEAPFVTVNFSFNNLTNEYNKTLNTFQTNAVIYSKVDNLYYQKDYFGNWNVIEQPFENPINQSKYYLRGMDSAFFNCQNLTTLIVEDASHIGERLKAWSFVTRSNNALLGKQFSFKDTISLTYQEINQDQFPDAYLPNTDKYTVGDIVCLNVQNGIFNQEYYYQLMSYGGWGEISQINTFIFNVKEELRPLAVNYQVGDVIEVIYDFSADSINFYFECLEDDSVYKFNYWKDITSDFVSVPRTIKESFTFRKTDLQFPNPENYEVGDIIYGSTVHDFDVVDYYYRCSDTTTDEDGNTTTVDKYWAEQDYTVRPGTISYTFYGCNNLKTVVLPGIKRGFDISASTRFTRDDLLVILNNLGKPAYGTSTLTMGSTNLNKLTAEDIKIATDKNWNLA